jgi:hypothetical protein
MSKSDHKHYSYGGKSVFFWEKVQAKARDSSVRLSAIAPRELKFCTMLCWYLDTNCTVQNFESVAEESRSWPRPGPSPRKIHLFLHN